MRLGRFDIGGHHHWCEVRGDRVVPLIGNPFHGEAEGIAEGYPLADVGVLVPVIPSKIVCVGRNYAPHAKELGNEIPTEPLLFMKPSTALVEHGGTILLPSASNRVDFEGEIGLVVGRTMKNVPPEHVRDYLFGVTCVNDVTARDIQRRDKAFTRGKGFDSFAPCGPWIETEFDLANLSVETHVNGQVRQKGHVSEMIFSPEVLLSFISEGMTLLPGDLIATGTPAGVGPLQAGDSVEITVGGVGTLSNTVLSG